MINTKLLPTTSSEIADFGWDMPDFILVSGDPYIDHPSFGTAVIGRVLEATGYKVAILAQPDAHDVTEYKALGRPRLGFLITAGSIDSMVANYTAAKRPRSSDSLSPGGMPGGRPDRALIVYANRCREAYKDCAVILGGLEASLRRFAHYDYWDNKVRRTVLLDSKADLLIYGMGERAICEVADGLNQGFTAREITWVSGTVYRAKEDSLPPDTVMLPSFEELSDKKKYCESYMLQRDNSEHVGSPLAELYPGDNYIVQNVPQEPLSSAELDAVYALPFTYEAHSRYVTPGNEIPALHEIKFSIAHVRGCYGDCAFCAITHHQGRIPTARSLCSVLDEARLMSKLSDFKGYIHDVGGPTANIVGQACKKQREHGTCKRKSCLFPTPCNELVPRQEQYTKLLQETAKLPNIKKVFVRSGIRYDLALADVKAGKKFIRELVESHVSGQLKVAPEHIAKSPLNCMRKPDKSVYEEFREIFEAEDARVCSEAVISGQKRNHQYLLPYFISAHPGCSMDDARELRKYILSHGGFFPEQIQDFYPTPGTLATCMYYTGMDPFTVEPIHVPGRGDGDPFERRKQRELLSKGK